MILSEEFFPDMEDISLDVKVKMIYGDNEDDIIGQYEIFTKVYDEQRKGEKRVYLQQERMGNCLRRTGNLRRAGRSKGAVLLCFGQRKLSP